MAGSADALAQLQNFNSSAQSPDQLLQSAQGSLGVQPAQQQVTGLQQAIQNTTNLLNHVAPSVMGRTQNSLVTNAQATRQIGNEQAPIQADLSKNTADEQTAESNLQKLQSEATQKAQLNLTGQQNQRSYLQQVYDDLYKQEQDAQARADAQAAAAQQAASSRAAAANSVPTFSTPSSTSTPSASPGAAQSTKFAQANDLSKIIGQLVQESPIGRNWGHVANYLAGQGIDTGRGSAADIALNSYFNSGGYNSYIKALQAEGKL